MKPTFKTDTKVGVFVIASLAILAVGITVVGRYHWGKDEGYRMTAVFDTISGLEERALVRIAGVIVGDVEKIYLKDGLAYVRMRLNPGAVLREDSQIGITALGMLGEKYVEITSGSLDKPVIPPESVVRGRESPSLDKIIEQFTEIAMDIKAVTASLRQFVGPKQEKSPLSELVKHFDEMVEGITDVVSKNKESIAAAVRGVREFAQRADGALEENKTDLREVIKNMKNLTAELQEKVKSVSASVTSVADKVGGSVDKAGRDFTAAVDEVKKVAAKVDEAVAGIRDLVDKAKRGEGTLGKLMADDTAYGKFDETLDAIRGVAKKIDGGQGTLGKLVTDDKAYTGFNEAVTSVNRYLTKSEKIITWLGFRSEYHFADEEGKSYFSLRINPRDDKFYLFELVSDPRGERTFHDSTTTVVKDGVTTVTKSHEVDYEDKFMITALYGQRFSDLSLRVGLIESMGGVGADYWFAKDRGRLSFDVWDFNRDEPMPHFKITADFNVWKAVHLQAGVDDLLEEGNRAFFAGGGVFFSDEDVKYVLGLMSLGK